MSGKRGGQPEWVIRLVGTHGVSQLIFVLPSITVVIAPGLTSGCKNKNTKRGWVVSFASRTQDWELTCGELARCVFFPDSVGPSGKLLPAGGRREREREGEGLRGEETLSDQSVASWSYVPLIRRHGLQSAITPLLFTSFVVLRCPCVPRHLPPQWR